MVRAGGREDDLEQPECGQEDLPVALQRRGDKRGPIPLAKHPSGRQRKGQAERMNTHLPSGVL